MSIEPARDSRGHWRRGHSGNPGGRPSGPAVRHVRALARQYAPEAIEALREIALDKDGQQMARVQAAKELLARGCGSVVDEVSLDLLERGRDQVEPIVFRMPMSVDGVLEGELVDDYDPPALPPGRSKA